jgi:hypothetical protein
MNDTRCPAPADKPLPETHSTGDTHSDRFCRKILQWSLRLYLALSPLSTEKKKKRLIEVQVGIYSDAISLARILQGLSESNL